jgi:cyclase
MTLTRRSFIITTSATTFYLGCGGRTAEAPPPQAAVPVAAPPVDVLTQMRTKLGSAPIEALKLADNLTMLYGPGGNVVVMNGPNGKIVVDTFVQPAWDKLKQTLDAMGNQPIKTLIDTHWHFDHTDNNAHFRGAGAQILAHENTKKRLSEAHDLLGMHFVPAPPQAMPTETFGAMYAIENEQIHLTHVAPAHTDTDIFVRYPKLNVLHMGDVFFNGMYPFIDASTGGHINGMIAGAQQGLKLADRRTKIVPGHGPLGDKAALTNFRDMLVTVRDRVAKMKKSGQTVEQVVAAKPSSDLDATWAKGMMPPGDFVAIVYNTLS